MHLPTLILVLLAATFATVSAARGGGDTSSHADRARLLAAYPQHLERFDGDDLVWKDGTRMPLDDGEREKPFETWLAKPDIADMLAVPYPSGGDASAPAKNVDPGRARNAAFFDKVYGDCGKGEVAKNLTMVAWLPRHGRQQLAFNRINGAAAALAAVSRELDALPPSFDVFLVPSAGTYNCRLIAGTDRVSAHGYAIAIDIGLKRSHYWRDAPPRQDGSLGFINEVPTDIVHIFERHGFIWGGRWYHYDTMHFEYRPELLGLPSSAGTQPHE